MNLGHSESAPMPVFVIKARDDLAVATIEVYAGLCTAAGLDDQREQVDRALDEIRAWRAANPDECRLPDHTHMPAGQPGSGVAPEVAITDDMVERAARAWEPDTFEPPEMKTIEDAARADARRALAAALGQENEPGESAS